MEEVNVDLQHNAKTLVLSELEKNGVISYMRAKLKKSVIDVIDKQKDSLKQSIEFDYMTPLHRLNKSKDIVMACHLIKEFLSFYEMEYTLPIFENESNIKESVPASSLGREFKLQDNQSKEDSKPVLLKLIEEYHAKTKKLEGLIGKNDIISNYNTSNTDAFISKLSNEPLTNPIIPKKQLSPINFVNKSIDMNTIDDKQSNDGSKFNTLNLDAVYGKQTNSSSSTQSKEENNTKMIQEPVIGGGLNRYVIEKEKGANQYDNEFQEIILEDIIPLKNNDEDEHKISMGNSASNMTSLGYDQSISNYNLNDFDYVEEAEKPLKS